MAIGSSLLLATALLATGCGDKDRPAPPPPPPVQAGDSWKLPGTPALKIVQVAPDQLVVLAEKHVYDEEDGHFYYVHDHVRHVFLLERGEEPRDLPVTLGASVEKSMVTDIAAGPNEHSVWVSSIHWNTAEKRLEPTQHLISDLGGERHEQTLPLEAAAFTGIDSSSECDQPFCQYIPEFDTLDVLRIASRDSTVGLVARNGAGTLYAESYAFEQGALVRTWRTALSIPLVAMRMGMTGGTYDVMGQLVNQYKVFAAFDRDGTLYAASSAIDAELQKLALTIPGPSLPDDLKPISYALVSGVTPGGMITSRQVVPMGGPLESLLTSLFTRDDRIFVTGLARDWRPEKQGESHLIVAELGGARQKIDVAKASGAALTLGLDGENRLVVGGSWSWTQNPAGVSIGGGDRFLSILSDVADPWDPPNLLAKGQRRSEARSILFPTLGVVCVAGMDNGPDTHAADGDISLIEGDGFVECLEI